VKVVINTCFGGYGLSKEAYKFLGIAWDGYGYEFKDKRADCKLVECVERLGKSASGEFAELKVVKIPEGVEYIIQEYDGVEWIAEKHRTWS